ncbi:protein DPCD [Bacillus rossius redtenbacheri]|uniref:protein DPCD n=1 Tax=Bacillus rossius redtenbacheri TaxID=93214 RepID=UPI002FDE11B1
MAADAWFEKLQNAEKLCVIKDGSRKVHYRFEDGEEMVEEYSLQTDVLTQRAWRRPDRLGRAGCWQAEVGDPRSRLDAPADSVLIQESSSTPVVTKRVTRGNLEWRVRNLPYPPEVYSVTADEKGHCITVRTSNHKYFKKLTVPELERVGLCARQENISFSHRHNTLVVTYKKPVEVLRLEARVLDLVKNLKTTTDDGRCDPS